MTLDESFGTIFINSSPTGAHILIDGADTGKVTPDTLKNVPFGAHTIHLSKQEYLVTPDSIVVEIVDEQVQSVHFALQEILQFYRFYVESIPPGAEIWVDNQPSAALTPDTIKVSPQTHTIKLLKNGYTMQEWRDVNGSAHTTLLSHDFTIIRRHLLEAFGNVSCTPCVQAAENLHQFAATHPSSEFTVVEYFASWPSPNDPFYKVAPQQVMQRVKDYSVASLPAFFVDGFISADSRFYDEIEDKYADALTVLAEPIGISVQKKLLDANLQVDVELYFPNAQSNADYKLFVAVVEDSIHFNTPPGSNGLVDFNAVFRGFLTAATGDAIPAQQSVVHMQFSMPWPTWNFSNSYIIAFIQDVSTKQVVQAGRTGG